MNYIYKIIILLNVFIFFSCSNREKCLQNFYQAEKAFSDQNFITAMKYAESSIKEDSSFLNSKILIGKIYFFNNQIELAYQTFKKLNKKEPYSQDVLLYLIRTCIELEKIDEAENLIKRGLYYNSNDWQLYYLYSRLEGIRCNQDKRLLYCRQAEKILALTENLYVELADIYLTLGLKDKAIVSLKTAEIVSLDPSSIKTIIKTIEHKDIQ